MKPASGFPLLRILIGLSVCLLLSCTEDESTPSSPDGNDTSSTDEFQLYTYSVVNVFPHAGDAYTQGLVYEDGFLYEGTGLHGRSSLRKVELETGKVLQRYDLPTAFFGEGITIRGDSIYQLTWTSLKGFIYRKADFDSIGEFGYTYFGWGLTHDRDNLILSDGTDTLYFLDPHTFQETGRVTVYDDDGPVVDLNELEYIDGKVFANVYRTDDIVIIDPTTGRVTGRIDLTGLYSSGLYFQPPSVLNGIAYDSEGDRLFVTGKNWLKLFEIELVPVD